MKYSKTTFQGIFYSTMVIGMILCETPLPAQNLSVPAEPMTFQKQSLLHAVDLRIEDAEQFRHSLKIKMDEEEIRAEEDLQVSEKNWNENREALALILEKISAQMTHESEIPTYLELSHYRKNSSDYLGNFEEVSAYYTMLIRMSAIFPVHLEISQIEEHIKDLVAFKEELEKVDTKKEAELLLEKIPHYYPAEALYGKPQVDLKNPSAALEQFIRSGKKLIENKKS